MKRVSEAIVSQRSRVIDFDLRAYFDTVRHDILLRKIVARINFNKKLSRERSAVNPQVAFEAAGTGNRKDGED